MRKKKHNADEVRFCQSRLHKKVYEFSHGEKGFLVSVEWENGTPLRMVVCEDCFKQNVGTLVEQITVERERVVA